MEKIKQMLYDELEGIFNEFFIDYDQENFKQNYSSFIDGIISNNYLEEGDFVGDEFEIRLMVISDAFHLLRNMCE